jgi:hypothetical protein
VIANQRARAPKKMALEQFLFLAWWVVKKLAVVAPWARGSQGDGGKL